MVGNGDEIWLQIEKHSGVVVLVVRNKSDGGGFSRHRLLRGVLKVKGG